MYLSIFAPFCIHSLRTNLSSGAGVCTSISHIIFGLSMYIYYLHIIALYLDYHLNINLTISISLSI